MYETLVGYLQDNDGSVYSVEMVKPSDNGCPLKTSYTERFGLGMDLNVYSGGLPSIILYEMFFVTLLCQNCLR